MLETVNKQCTTCSWFLKCAAFENGNIQTSSVNKLRTSDQTLISGVCFNHPRSHAQLEGRCIELEHDRCEERGGLGRKNQHLVMSEPVENKIEKGGSVRLTTIHLKCGERKTVAVRRMLFQGGHPAMDKEWMNKKRLQRGYSESRSKIGMWTVNTILHHQKIQKSKRGLESKCTMSFPSNLLPSWWWSGRMIIW